MGVHKLMALINEKAPKAVNEIYLDEISTKDNNASVVIDGSMFLYQSLLSPLFSKSFLSSSNCAD